MQATLDHPGATAPLPLRTSQQVTRAALVVVGAISVLGGCLQMVLGQPDTTPRLDNVHRFLAGVYLGSGFISLWAAATIRRQGGLVYLIALGVLMAGLGRLVSIAQVGLPQPASVWLGYLIPELLLAVGIAASHWRANRS